MNKSMTELTYTEKDGLLYPNLQISNDPTSDQPLGRYGKMALEYLKTEYPERYTVLKMDGSLMETMHRVQTEATERIENLIQEQLKSNPIPENPITGFPTEDTLERTRHLNSLKLTAEEIVMSEIILITR